MDDVTTDTSADGPEVEAGAAPGAAASDARLSFWNAELDRADRKARDRTALWSKNVGYRVGKPFDTASDSDRIQIPFDWSATKAKQAQLFSQVPEARLNPREDEYKAGVPVFAKKLNGALGKARVGVAMDECLPDVINAAGVAGVIISFDSLTVRKSVPAVPPEVAAMLQAAGMDVPMEDIDQPTSTKLSIARVSPADLRAPDGFTGSDFDDSPWVGRCGRTSWVDAKKRFKLKAEDKANVLGAEPRGAEETLSTNTDVVLQDVRLVEFREVFYWRYLYHEDEMDFEAIHHLVFVRGLEKPVIDEPWKGQRRNADGRIVGPCKSPLRFLTLTYVSDESMPPSDSAIGRPQVDELIRSRSFALKQRETSLPMRWMDINRLDAAIQDQMLRGTWQGVIPVNGNGDKVLGEVARASYPQEDYRFDDIARADLNEAWQVSPNQVGGKGPQVRSAAEANIIQSNFQTRVGYERARVVSFFCGIAEVVGGLLCVLDQFTDKERQALQGWNLEEMSSYYFYEVRADATVLKDAAQRIDQLERFINLAAKSGYVNVKPVIEEFALLTGLNPAEVVIDPQPAAPEPTKVALSVAGSEDLQNPMVVALLNRSGQMPNAQEIEAAKQVIMAAAGPLAPAVAGGAPGNPPPTLPPHEDPHPNWNAANRVEKRMEDGQ